MAGTLRLVQVSDTHLSETHSYFTDNYDVFVNLMRADPPDLIIHSGDVAFNGPCAPGDLAFGHASLARLPSPWRAIPGNHDVGEASQMGHVAKQPVTPQRRAAWANLFGEGYWAQDFGDWRLIGLDTGLKGSGLNAEAAQAAFLDAALTSWTGKPAMVFMHLPPFTHDPDEAKFTRGALNLPMRKTLLERCAAGGVRAIACGHLHIYRTLQHKGMDIVWAPATSYVSIPTKVNAETIIARAGYVEWSFTATQLTHRVVEPPEMLTLDAHRWMVERGSITSMPQRAMRQV